MGHKMVTVGVITEC